MSGRSCYSIRIEPDDLPKCEGKFMVVIRCLSENGHPIHGIPLRNATAKVAESMLRPLQYAFEYGVTASRDAYRSLDTRITVAENET